MARVQLPGVVITAMTIGGIRNPWQMGDFLVRVETIHPDPLLKEGIRLPVADVEASYEKGKFVVHGGRGVEVATKYLTGLTKKDTKALIADCLD